MSEKQTVAGSTASKELLSDRPIFNGVFLPIGNLFLDINHNY